MAPDVLILSCEHASRRVPARYADLFANKSRARVLETHRAYDAGALWLARAFERALRAPLFVGNITRLLVDLNRSSHHPSVFSGYSRELSERARQGLLSAYHFPYQERVRQAVRSSVVRGRSVLHLSVHSFTPRLHGQTRRADVGLLYDPARTSEARYAAAWRQQLLELAPELRVRRNYPYRGRDDGLTSALRREFSARAYLGLELEVNQRVYFADKPMTPQRLARVLLASMPCRARLGNGLARATRLAHVR